MTRFVQGCAAAIACWAATAAYAADGYLAANKPADVALDLSGWRRLLVHHSERIKPLDTAARETILEIVGRTEFRPEAFSGLSPTEILDWTELREHLQAPAADAERTEPSQDGRSDRFKSGEAGGTVPTTRVRDLLTPGLRRKLRDADFSKDEPLRAELDAAAERMLGRRKDLFDRKPDMYMLHELRAKAAEAKDEKLLAEFAAYDRKRAEWLAIREVKAQLLTELNGMIGFAQFYDKKFWFNDPASDEAKALIAADPKKLSKDKVSRLNRVLLAEAFPKAIAPPGPAMPAWAPEHGRKYDPLMLYLTWLFTWQGWDAFEKGPGPTNVSDEIYAAHHKFDEWDRTPMVPVGYFELDPLLLQETPHHAAPMTPIEFKPFRAWTLEINRRAAGLEGKDLEKFPERLLEVERRARIAAERAMLFRFVRTGLHFEIGPPLDEDHRWMPLFFLVTADNDWSRPPYASGSTPKLKAAFHGARKAFLAKDAAAFSAKSAEFLKHFQGLHNGYAARLRKERDDSEERSRAKVSAAGLSLFDFLDDGKEWDSFPTAAMVDTEVFYNEFQPFWKTALVGFVASLFLAVALGVRQPAIYWLGFLGLLGAVGLMASGLWMRVTISGRAPVTNMFETVLWASLVAATVGVVLSLIYKQRVLALSAAITLALASTIAVNMPANMGASIRPLEPVLRSQKWLIIHVMTIVASYGAFMLAWLLSTIGLAHYFRPNPDKKACKDIATFVYRAMQVGVVLLFAGTALGGWWAADSWGRFWGWDAKEVWALIALLTYIAVLHARFVGLKTFGTMVGSSLAFTMIVGSWYGVNFLFPAGLHAYAINSGGQMYVIGGVLGNLTYVFAAWLLRSLYRTRQAVMQPAAAPSQTDVREPALA